MKPIRAKTLPLSVLMETLSIKQEDIILIDDYITPNKTVEKKEETIETSHLNFLVDEEEDDCFSKSFSPNLAIAKPMEGLNEVGPTPFLKKTFDMVEDPSTNGIISWSGSKKSFVVWDYHQFSTQLLPKNFKHNNFSSFIRQLNTYGFKKIDPDRWEFANEGFQEGQKHMLKNIKRRKQIPQPNSGIEAEIDKLNNDRTKLKMEISKLKHQQESTQGHLTAVKERLERNEYKQQQMFVFVSKVFSNPGFLHKFIKVLRHERGNCDTPIAKKQRVTDQKHEEFARVDSEREKLFPPPLDGECSSGSEGQKGEFTSGLGSEDYISKDKLWKDEFVCETKVQNEGKFGEDRNNFESELEELITKPSEHWSNYMSDMVVQVADGI